MVVKHPKLENSLTFENLTVAPYCRELIDTSILSPAEVDYINKFHEMVILLFNSFLVRRKIDSFDGRKRVGTCIPKETVPKIVRSSFH